MTDLQILAVLAACTAVGAVLARLSTSQGAPPILPVKVTLVVQLFSGVAFLLLGSAVASAQAVSCGLMFGTILNYVALARRRQRRT